MKINGRLIFLILLLIFVLASCDGEKAIFSHPSCPKISDAELFSDITSLVAESYSDTPLFTAQCIEKSVSDTVYKMYTPHFYDETLNMQIFTRVVEKAEAVTDAELVRVDYIYSESHGITSFLFTTEIFNGGKCVASSVDSLNFETQSHKILSLSDCFDEDDTEIVALLEGSDASPADFYISPERVIIYSGNDKFSLPAGSLKLLEERKIEALREYIPVTDPKEKVIALTFDDGPSALTTPGLCDMLFEKGVKATFFVLGVNLDGSSRNMATLKKLYDNGNEIGIHSYNHPNFNLMSLSSISKQIEDTQALIVSATGERSVLVRPPYGNMKREVAQALDYFIIRWSVDPEDWKDKTPEEISDFIINDVQSGDIILLHDIHSRSCEAAETVIDALLAQGYRFVTVSELYDFQSKTADGRQYFDINDK